MLRRILKLVPGYAGSRLPQYCVYSDFVLHFSLIIFTPSALRVIFIRFTLFPNVFHTIATMIQFFNDQ